MDGFFKVTNEFQPFSMIATLKNQIAERDVEGGWRRPRGMAPDWPTECHISVPSSLGIGHFEL